MKKLMMMAAAMIAACVAQADFITWTVDDSFASAYSWTYATIMYKNGASDTPSYLLASSSAGVTGTGNNIYQYSDYSATDKGYGYAYMDANTDYSSSLFYVVLLSDNYSTIAEGYKLAYDTIKGGITFTSVEGGVTPASSGYATFTGAVPEPTSGLLLLVGAAMLALKRKRA